MADSVKIVHKKEECVGYRFVADFFRFIGFFVYNYYYQETAGEAHTQFTISLDADYKVLDGEVCVKLCASDNGKEDLFDQIIDGILEKKMIKEPDAEALRLCAQVYIKKDIMKYMNTTNTFYRSEDLMDECEKAFYDAHIELNSKRKDESDALKSKYLIYAIVNSARSVNEICNVCRKERIFDTKKMVALSKTALEIDPDFVNVYVLDAFLTDLDKMYAWDAIYYYNKALEKISAQPYASYVFYRLGRNYEKIMRNMEKALTYYENSYNVNKENYRALYKLAIFNKAKKDYRKACEQFERIIDMLRDRYEKGTLHAIGYEYLYKAKEKLGEIYRENLKMPGNALKYYNEIMELFDALEGGMGNTFYAAVYGEQYKDYLKKTGERFQKHKIYMDLCKTYIDLGDQEKADEYWDKAKDLRN